MSMLKAAAAYAFEGLYVFPCEKKIPLTGLGGFKNASLSALQIARWWTDNPDAQVALPTGAINHLFVIDIDGPEGERAAEKLNLPETFTVETRPGRYQLWFRQPEGTKSKCTASVLGPQLDSRGDSGYVIAPPSIHHITNRPYEVLKDIPWAPAPISLLNPEKSSSAPRSEAATDQIPQGQRHPTLLSIAGALRARHLSPEMVLAQLRIVNAQQCVPPLEDSELQRLARYIGTKEPGFRGQRGQPQPVDLEIAATSYDTIPKEHLRFLWPQYIPVGKLVHLAGHSTEGKTPILTDLAARISVGATWPDGERNTLGPRSVILLSAEDDPSDTIRPRLELAGADLKKIFRLRATIQKEQGPQERMLALGRDLQKLVAIARSIPDLALIGIDPVTNYMGEGVRITVEDEVRPILMPLSLAAADLNITIITIGHLNRREKGTESLHRILGAAAFSGVARFVFLTGPDPEDEDKYAHVLLQRRGVGAPSLRYSTFSEPVSWAGETSEVIGLKWRGRSQATAEDLVDPAGSEEKSTIARAGEMVREMLRDGRVASKAAMAQLVDAGFSPQIRQTRVLAAARAASKRFPGDTHWSWYLPSKDLGL